MRTLRIWVCILTVVSVVASVTLWFISVKMNEKPVITCTVEGDIEVSSRVTDEELLKLVTATDSRDGDISDKIIIERKNYFISKGLTSINYAVCDSDNNVTKLEKHLRFTDYHSPVFTMKGDFVAYAKNAINFSNIVGAEDIYDGDISDRVKIISNTYNNAYAGQYDVNCKVTNSFGDTSEISFKAIVINENPNISKISLNNYIIYTKAGEEPDFSANISSSAESYGHININTEEYDADTPGVYSVYYETANQVRARVIVVVQGAENESN